MNEKKIIEFVFTFDTVKDAVMGEKILLDAGIEVMVMPKPHQLGSRCGICLRVKPDDLEKACSVPGFSYRLIYAAGFGESSSAPAELLPRNAVDAISADYQKVYTLWKA
jgi:hypothetical protein